MDIKLVHINHVGGDLYVVRPAHIPATPDQGLPGEPTIPGVPDNTLPTTPPPQVPSGMILVIVRGPDGKWRWATTASMPTPLPEPPPTAQPKS